jgi:hypothetical protein
MAVAWNRSQHATACHRHDLQRHPVQHDLVHKGPADMVSACLQLGASCWRIVGGSAPRCLEKPAHYPLGFQKTPHASFTTDRRGEDQFN